MKVEESPAKSGGKLQSEAEEKKIKAQVSDPKQDELVKPLDTAAPDFLTLQGVPWIDTIIKSVEEV